MANHAETRVKSGFDMFLVAGYLLSEAEISHSSTESRLYCHRYSTSSQVRIHWALCLLALLQVQRLLVHFLRRHHTQV